MDLQWDMRWPTTTHCRVSRELWYGTWSHVRSFAATHPPVPVLRILCDELPWDWNVSASENKMYVTCGDVIESIQAFLRLEISRSEWNARSTRDNWQIHSTFQHNRSRSEGLPQGWLPNSILRLDLLGKRIKFGGLVEVDSNTLPDTNVRTAASSCPTFMLTHLEQALIVPRIPDRRHHRSPTVNQTTRSTVPESSRSGTAPAGRWPGGVSNDLRPEMMPPGEARQRVRFEDPTLWSTQCLPDVTIATAQHTEESRRSAWQESGVPLPPRPQGDHRRRGA